MTQQLVGGVFPLEEPDVTTSEGLPPWEQGRVHRFANARSAVRHIARHTGTGPVWLPSFVCGAVPDAMVGCARDVRFYPVGRRLVPEGAWVEEVHDGDLVVVVDYFGFPARLDLIEKLRGRGARVLRDAAQALLTDPGASYDFEVLSPRKFLGVADGGLLVDHTGDLPTPELRPPDGPWWQASLGAVMGRRDFDRAGGDRAWFTSFQTAEVLAPHSGVAMSELSQALLASGLQHREVARRRRHNYGVLLDLLSDVALLPELPMGVVPLGFPIVLAERDRVRESLFARGVYPPVHWPLEGVVPERFVSSHQLAQHITTLICDQRYGEDEMRLQADLVRAAR